MMEELVEGKLQSSSENWSFGSTLCEELLTKKWKARQNRDPDVLSTFMKHWLCQ